MRARMRRAVPTAAALVLLGTPGCDAGDSRVLSMVRSLVGSDSSGSTASAAGDTARSAAGPPAAASPIEVIEGAEVSSYPDDPAPEEPLYGYLDASGSMRMVRGLANVPPEYRARARDLGAVTSFNRVATPSPRTAPARGAGAQPDFNPNRFDAVLYSSESCGHCARTRSLLDSLGVSYELRDIHRDPGARDEVRRVLGRVSVPLLGVDGAWVSGYQPDAIKRALGLGG